MALDDLSWLISLAILAVTYALIVSDRVHNAIAGLVGICLTLLVGGALDMVTFDDVIGYIDFNTIFLLMGMMIIVGVISKTGLFQLLALKSYKLASGRIWLMLIILCSVTAMLSAFLDNVTTVLLMAPVTVELTRILRIDPIPFLISEALSANVGGTSTLIGDPPNILIGSEAGFSFVDFLSNLAPIVLIIFMVLISTLSLFYGKGLGIEWNRANRPDIKELEERYKIVDRGLFYRALGVLVFTVVLFVLQDFISLPVAVSALLGATVLLVITNIPVGEALKGVEWPTLIFFMGLLVLAGGANDMGLLPMIADGIGELSGEREVLALLLVLWISAIASSLMGALPMAAMMIPIVGGLGGGDLYWALALGVCLGGNGTYLGTASSLVLVGFSESYGYPISFKRYAKVGIPIMLITVAIASLYIVLRYAW
jgi:Na+/H+ antiporter NhaD/arsenite permease-like protein